MRYCFKLCRGLERANPVKCRSLPSVDIVLTCPVMVLARRLLACLSTSSYSVKIRLLFNTIDDALKYLCPRGAWYQVSKMVDKSDALEFVCFFIQSVWHLCIEVLNLKRQGKVTDNNVSNGISNDIIRAPHLWGQFLSHL